MTAGFNYTDDSWQCKLWAAARSCNLENLISQQAQMLFKRLVTLCGSAPASPLICGTWCCYPGSQAVAVAIDTSEGTGG